MVGDPRALSATMTEWYAGRLIALATKTPVGKLNLPPAATLSAKSNVHVSIAGVKVLSNRWR